MLISEIYHKRVDTIHENATIRDAVKEILHTEHNGLLVSNDAGKVVGVLSMQDIAGATVPVQYLKNVSLASATYKSGFFQEIINDIKMKKVKEIMRTDFMKVTLKSHIIEVAADFLQKDLYIVPVFDDGHVIGIITRTEIKKAFADAMEIE